MSCENVFGEMIYSYSRHQAIEDGVLADLSHLESVRHHWKYPFACTLAVWGVIEEALQIEGQDVNGIMHDVGVLAKIALRTTREVQQVLFIAIIGRTKHRLKLHVGPGDRGEPVLTLMLAYED